MLICYFERKGRSLVKLPALPWAWSTISFINWLDFSLHLFSVLFVLSSVLNYALHLFSLLDPFFKKSIHNCYFSPKLQPGSCLIKNNKFTPLLFPLPKPPLPPRAPQFPLLISQFFRKPQNQTLIPVCSR